MSPCGYQEPTTVLAGGLHRSRDMLVHVRGVTNTVMRARWPSSRCWRGHPRRRSPSSVIHPCQSSSIVGCWSLSVVWVIVSCWSLLVVGHCPSSIVVLVVIGSGPSSSCPHCGRCHHWNGTANWPSLGMTMSLCIVHVSILVLPSLWGSVAVAVQMHHLSVWVGVRESGHAPVPGGGCTTNPARTLSTIVHRHHCCPLLLLSLSSEQPGHWARADMEGVISHCHCPLSLWWHC